MTMPAHPVAEWFPLLEGAELQALADDIKANGLLEPVVVHRGLVLDGRNRLRACELAGIEVETREWEGEEAEIVPWVISKNLHRRHLSEWERSKIAAKLATLQQGGTGANQHADASIEASAPKQADAAKLLQVSRTAVQNAKTITERGAPEVVEAVDRGEVAPTVAAKLVRSVPDPIDQRVVVEVAREGASIAEAVAVVEVARATVPDADPAALLERAKVVRAEAISARPDYDGDTWGTPAEVLEDARAVLEGIDLDPASNSIAQARVRATTFYTAEDNGLDPSRPWTGRVWMNPPYSYPLVEQFTSRLVAEYDAGHVTAALVLVNNCTDAAWFQALLRRFPVCFTAGRISFLYGDGSKFATRQGQAFFYLGPDVARFAAVFGERGTVVVATARGAREAA